MAFQGALLFETVSSQWNILYFAFSGWTPDLFFTSCVSHLT
jgi:hypothetical protein